MGGEQKLQKNPLVGHGVEKDKRLNLRIIHQTEEEKGRLNPRRRKAGSPEESSSGTGRAHSAGGGER